MQRFILAMATTLTFFISNLVAEATTTRDVVIMTFQNHPEIQALRHSFQSERFLSASLEANFNELRKGFRISSEYGKRGDTSKITPNGEVFIEKNLGGYSFSGNVGSDFSASRFGDESRGYAELRAEIPLIGSNKVRDQAIRLLKQESDVIIAQIAFLEKAREQIKDATDAYNEAVANKNFFEQNEWYIKELHKLRKVASSRGDPSALKKIDKLIYDAETAGRALKANFEADLNLLRSRMGVGAEIPLHVTAKPFNVELAPSQDMINAALKNDPQLRSLVVAESVLLKQKKIINSATVDVLGSIKIGADFPGYGRGNDENGYAASGGLVLLFSDSRVRESQLGAVDAKLKEIVQRIKGIKNTLPLVIAEKYRRAEVFKKKRNDIAVGLNKSADVYIDKLKRYRVNGVIFDELYLALQDFYKSQNDYEYNAQEYANRVTELLRSAGSCFRVLEEANISLDIN